MSTPSTEQRSVFRRKPVDAFVTETGPTPRAASSSRSMGLFQLTMFGVGATIGTGIFIVLTEAVPEAGPAVIVSFILAGITAALTAVCYAELASTIPVSGSSYSYTYATMGEIVAFGVAACLLLEYGVSSAAVSVGWSQYLNSLFSSRVRLSHAGRHNRGAGRRRRTQPPGHRARDAVLPAAHARSARIREGEHDHGPHQARGPRPFHRYRVHGLFGQNFEPFAPFGIAGIGVAASSIFFSFIGLDAVSTAGEEVHNPRRNLPLAILFATIVVTMFYILVSLAAIGAQPYQDFEGQEAGLAAILRNITGSTCWSAILAAGAVISIFSVTLVTLYGQTRILFAMGRDGMLPEVFHRMDPPPSPRFATR